MYEVGKTVWVWKRCNGPPREYVYVSSLNNGLTVIVSVPDRPWDKISCTGHEVQSVKTVVFKQYFDWLNTKMREIADGILQSQKEYQALAVEMSRAMSELE
jgi:hypothetical protein